MSTPGEHALNEDANRATHKTLLNHKTCGCKDGCMVCKGGLAICADCGAGEQDLWDRPCTGAKMQTIRKALHRLEMDVRFHRVLQSSACAEFIQSWANEHYGYHSPFVTIGDMKKVMVWYDPDNQGLGPWKFRADGATDIGSRRDVIDVCMIASALAGNQVVTDDILGLVLSLRTTYPRMPK